MNVDAPSGNEEDDKVVLAKRKNHLADDGPEAPLLPRADVGVLLVHGIGNHREGVTLRAFGQPMLDWLKEWLRGKGDGDARGTVFLSEARFNDATAPAYALARIRAGEGKSEASAEETWLFCEGWWGATVQSPASFQLLRWMWTRAPLLIYWHFYVRRTARPAKSTQARNWDVFASIVAFLLAGFCQTVIGVAMILWLIPIGPWQRKVVAAVRILTLTLGDSYVLEEDIQRAALVERVRRALHWLTERADRAVIIAHSQGGAIAHEVLRQETPSRLRLFISVGSGLEKLDFLREVVTERAGLVLASLLFPLVVAGVAIIFHGRSSSGNGEIGLGVSLLIIAFGFSAGLLGHLANYKKLMIQRSARLELPELRKDRWIDLYASDDVVPMSRGSLLEGAGFVSRERVFNERSYVRDHVSYFTNQNDCLPRIWEKLAGLSDLPIFRDGDLERLRRFSFVHRGATHVISYSRLALFIALFVGAYFLRNPLLNIGQTVLTGAEGTVAADWLRPVHALASVLASIVQRLWKPDAVSADLLANALFGAAILLAALALWWTVFRSIWAWRRTARWRKACRGGDVYVTRGGRIRFWLGCVTFFGFGCLPLAVSIGEYLTREGFFNVVAVALALCALLFTVLLSACAPWMIEVGRQDASQPLPMRILSPLAVGLCVVGMLWTARWLWPGTVEASTRSAILVGVALLLGLACQVHTSIKLRSHSAYLSIAAIIALPLLGALLCVWVGPAKAYFSAIAYLSLSLLSSEILFGGWWRKRTREGKAPK